MRNRIMPGVYIVIIPYVIVSICYLLFRHYIPGVLFQLIEMVLGRHCHHMQEP